MSSFIASQPAQTQQDHGGTSWHVARRNCQVDHDITQIEEIKEAIANC